MILSLFFARSERAIEELGRKYGAPVTRVAGGILGDRRDTEECVSDTWLAAWNAIPPARPHPLLTWICAVARNLALKRYHADTARKRHSRYDVALSELEAQIPALETVETEYAARALTAALNTFLDGCGEEDRFLFVRRYWFADSVSHLAGVLHCTPHRVSVRLFRLRKRLQSYLEKEGISV